MQVQSHNQRRTFNQSDAIESLLLPKSIDKPTATNDKNNLKSANCPPYIEEMRRFEKDLVIKMLENIKFRNANSQN